MFNGGYNSFYPYQNIGTKTGLFSLFKGKINWSTLLNNTQKTLNILNQAIPVFYQVKPMWNNTKTIFKIIGAVKDDGKRDSNLNPNRNIQKTNQYINNNYINENTPNFFL
jgi:hypothetical protein